MVDHRDEEYGDSRKKKQEKGSPKAKSLYVFGRARRVRMGEHPASSTKARKAGRHSINRPMEVRGETVVRPIDPLGLSLLSRRNVLTCVSVLVN
jgi:hypothetical protein